MALGRNGDLYTWGKGDYHRLGESDVLLSQIIIPNIT